MASTDKIEAFLAEPRNLIVAGIRRDGRPHLSPNWSYRDGRAIPRSLTAALQSRCAIGTLAGQAWPQLGGITRINS